MDTYTIADMGLVEEALALQERSHGLRNGASDAGERLNAAKDRVVGADKLATVVMAVKRAIRAATPGDENDGQPVGIVLDSSHNTGVEGREYALRGAIADIRIITPTPHDKVAAAMAEPDGTPDGAVEICCLRHDGGCAVDIRFMSAGSASPGSQEALQVMRDCGIKVDFEASRAGLTATWTGAPSQEQEEGSGDGT